MAVVALNMTHMKNELCMPKVPDGSSEVGLVDAGLAINTYGLLNTPTTTDKKGKKRRHTDSDS